MKTSLVLFLCVLLFVKLSATQTVDPTDSISLIRHASQAYLDQYFNKFEIGKSKTTTQIIETEELRQRVVACMGLSQMHMKEFRQVYLEEALKASKRLSVREDDSLRLFFIGDLLACLENTDTNTATRYTQLLQSGRRSALGATEINRVFKRTGSTPVEFSDSQAQVLSSIVDTYLTVGGEDGSSSIISSIFQSLPISFLAGNMGLCYCAGLLIAMLGGVFVVDMSFLQPKPTESAVKSSSESPLPSKQSPSGKSKKPKRK